MYSYEMRASITSTIEAYESDAASGPPAAAALAAENITKKAHIWVIVVQEMCIHTHIYIYIHIHTNLYNRGVRKRCRSDATGGGGVSICGRQDNEKSVAEYETKCVVWKYMRMCIHIYKQQIHKYIYIYIHASTIEAYESDAATTPPAAAAFAFVADKITKKHTYVLYTYMYSYETRASITSTIEAYDSDAAAIPPAAAAFAFAAENMTKNPFANPRQNVFYGSICIGVYIYINNKYINTHIYIYISLQWTRTKAMPQRFHRRRRR